MKPRRYNLDALVAASGLTEHALGRKVGMDGTALRRAREHGLVESAADRYATRAGFHPHSIWPEMGDHAFEDHAVECAERSCTERFVPTRKGHRYCSPACRRRHADREWKRRRYQTDPEFRAAENARKRQYHVDAARAIKANRARWYQENAARTREANRRYREAHREEIKAKRRAYYLANREEIIAKQMERDRARRAATARQDAHMATSGPGSAQAAHATVDPMTNTEEAA